MTFIVSWAQKDMVLQLSDRKLTITQRNKTDRPYPKPANKSVMFNGRVIFGFTGPAFFDGVPVDIWTANRLKIAGDDLDAATNLLRDDLNTVFRKRDYRGQPFAIVMSGYYYDNDNLRPFHGRITNKDNENWNLSPVARDFTCYMTACPSGHSGIQETPPRLSRSQFEEINESLADDSNVVEIVSRLARAMRQIADRDPGVGHDLTLAALPINAAYRLKTYSISDGMPNAETPTFAYLAKNDETVMYAPTIVMAGQVISDLRLERAKSWTAWR